MHLVATSGNREWAGALTLTRCWESAAACGSRLVAGRVFLITKSHGREPAPPARTFMMPVSGLTEMVTPPALLMSRCYPRTCDLVIRATCFTATVWQRPPGDPIATHSLARDNGAP